MDQIFRLHRKLTTHFYFLHCRSTFIINIILRQVYSYSTAATYEAAYIIGGYQDSTYSSTIAEFKNDMWRKLGDLTQARNHHRSISIGQQTMILGGSVDHSG